MKKLLTSALFLLAGISSPQVATADNVTTLPALHVSAQFSSNDFEYLKECGSYGLGIYATSIGHWGNFHVGANANLGVNAGLIDDWGMQVEFGPSARYDLGKRFFVNLPINALCSCTFPEGSTGTHTEWGITATPTLHAWITPKFGIFAGPKMAAQFDSESDICFGFVAGISYAF